MLCHFRELCSQQALHANLQIERWRQVTLTTTEDMETLIDDLVEALNAAGYSDHAIFGIRLALEEAIVNALKHGHQYNPDKQVQVRFHLTDVCLQVQVEDEGPGFSPEEVPDPLEPENLERECGRGLFLMRNFMTSIHYNTTGNCVTLCKQRG